MAPTPLKSPEKKDKQKKLKLSLKYMYYITMHILRLKAVLRIQDVYPRSRILIFTHLGSRIRKQQQKRGVEKNLLAYLFL